MADVENENEVSSPDPYYEPVVKLEPKTLDSLEHDEDELIKLRAKSYRYVIDDEDGPQWKERGVGHVKLLKHKTKGTVRILMRRDKTLKICINHHLLPSMNLQPHCSSDKAFVWNTPADFADEEAKQETLAIKFGNADNAKQFKEIFERSLRDVGRIIGPKCRKSDQDENKTLSDELAKLKVANEKADEESKKAVNGHEDEDSRNEKESKVLEGKESEES